MSKYLSNLYINFTLIHSNLTKYASFEQESCGHFLSKSTRPQAPKNIIEVWRLMPPSPIHAHFPSHTWPPQLRNQHIWYSQISDKLLKREAAVFRNVS